MCNCRLAFLGSFCSGLINYAALMEQGSWMLGCLGLTGVRRNFFYGDGEDNLFVRPSLGLIALLKIPNGTRDLL